MQTSFPAIVTILALLLYAGLSFYVGLMRGRHGVAAPSVTGPPEFERAFRVHQNTQEQLVLFIPALWLFVFFVSALWGGMIGLVWIGGRSYYAYSYFRDPDSRGPGFIVAMTCSLVMLLGALLGALAGAIVNLR
jgi:glutathione S-transferase